MQMEGHRSSLMAVKFTSLEKEQSKDCSSVHRHAEAFQSLGRGEADSYVFPSNKRHGTSHSTSDWRCMPKWGRAAGFHVHPHQLRHSHATHAVQRGVDVFTLRRRSVTHRARPLVITSAKPGTAVLCVLVDEFILDSDALLGLYFSPPHRGLTAVGFIVGG